MIWFTSDWHLNHKNIIKYSKRPFLTIEEMNECIISNFFKKIGNEKADVYFLGDLSFDKISAENFLKKIPKQIKFHFIRGNHDKNIKNSFILKNCDASIIEGYKDIKIEGQKITLCHYPMYSWNCSHFGSWMIHGHIHNQTENKFYGKIMNVCVDLHNYEPISFNEVKKYMNKRENNWDFIVN